MPVHVALGELGAALSLSVEALERFPDEARAHGHVGLVLFTMDRGDEAERYFERAVEFGPAIRGRATGAWGCSDAAARYEEALEHLQVVTEVSPGNAQGGRNMGIVFLQLERYPEAIDAFDQSLALAPNQESVIAAREAAQGRLG